MVKPAGLSKPDCFGWFSVSSRFSGNDSDDMGLQASPRILSGSDLTSCVS
jgi:hypothetical protein